MKILIETGPNTSEGPQLRLDKITVCTPYSVSRGNAKCCGLSVYEEYKWERERMWTSENVELAIKRCFFFKKKLGSVVQKCKDILFI